MNQLQEPTQTGGPEEAGPVASPFERLQARLLARALHAFPEPRFDRPLREAILLSARVALATASPMLILPELFREVAITAMMRVESSQSLRNFL